MMGEHDSAISTRRIRQMRKTRMERTYSPRDVEELNQSLQQLDATVASVAVGGSSYLPHRRTAADDPSIASKENSTGLDHSVYAHPNLIYNMDSVTEEEGRKSSRRKYKRSVGTRSSRSRSLRSRVSRKSHMSSLSSRTRGASLERDISRTILLTASLGAQNAHFVIEPDDQTISSQDILLDLDQASTVMSSETRVANLLPPIDSEVEEQDLLPPVANDDCAKEKKSDGRHRTVSRTLFAEQAPDTPPTSDDSFHTPTPDLFSPDLFVDFQPVSFESAVFDDAIATGSWTHFGNTPFNQTAHDFSWESPASVARLNTQFNRLPALKSGEKSLEWQF